MQSRYVHYYQFFAWLSVFSLITGSIHFSRGLADQEIYFAISLIFGTGLYSYLSRYGFKRFLNTANIFYQVLYFITQSALGASFGASLMVLSILLFISFGLVTPIPDDMLWFAIKTMFWGNWNNMFGASLFWSVLYLLLTKVRQLYAMKEALASSQLEVLSQQLNPHFLFNTLNNIRASILEEPEKARDSLAQLSDMLRYSLEQHSLEQHSLEQHQSPKVLLEKELEILEEYIALCKIQYEDRLSFESDINSKAKRALIPKLLLQLCVENAIKHGIGNLVDGGTIFLKVNIEQDKSLHIHVSNPIPRANEGSLPKSSSGIGIKNIRRRLALLYPKNSAVSPSLSLSYENDVAIVTIILPLEKSEDDK
ncbi:histidine kinase [Glaciecola sp. MH2013]|uniref:sensor histidine kinase n=1 Tax=Glaciecola sp. MH2013 TaxID=2785524 RepID=UPI00189E516D|nr:histidine kinase [Glaciecola sp. MH2013]MBF7071831.1 histidine kinase [Glaciecola sp. MH2013]